MSKSTDSATGSTSQEIQLMPVGVVRNQSRELNWGKKFSALKWQERAAGMRRQSESVSLLIIDASLDGILDGIDDFSHLMVLYWAHLVPPERRSVTRVHPLGSNDFPLVGVFATHSPVRPNAILITVVHLLERNGNILKVAGLDALDGSPILDIKPYIPDHNEYGEVKAPHWMSKMHREFSEDKRSGPAGGVT